VCSFGALFQVLKCAKIVFVKLVSKIKLLPAIEQKQFLLDTLCAANRACEWISERAWHDNEFGQYNIHKKYYTRIRTKFKLSAQMAVRAIAKVADSYKSQQGAKCDFKLDGAIAYDSRILSWNIKNKTVSIWTLKGRQTIRFVVGERQYELLKSQQGESDLILHRGNWYLAATCNVEEPSLCDVDDFLGVDCGITNIAVDSDGNVYSGAEVKKIRRKRRFLRSKLQRKHTTSAYRKLKKTAGKEYRFATYVNHVVSKQIVATAKGTNRGIAIEDLKGIHDRITVRPKQQRIDFGNWAFAQLREFLEYKAKLAGVVLVAINPRYTSCECSKCHYISKSNRLDQATFRCGNCGYRANADVNAAMNLRIRSQGICKLPVCGSRTSVRPTRKVTKHA
jgi:putative transposase